MVSADQLAYAAHLRNTGHSITEIVAQTGIARTSLYRHLPPREPEPITAAVPLPPRGSGMVGRVERMLVLRPHLEHGVPLARAATDAAVPIRTARRWLAAYRAGGPAALEPAVRGDRGSAALIQNSSSWSRAWRCVGRRLRQRRSTVKSRGSPPATACHRRATPPCARSSPASMPAWSRWPTTVPPHTATGSRWSTAVSLLGRTSCGRPITRNWT